MLSTFAYTIQVCTLKFPVLYFQTVFQTYLSSVSGFWNKCYFLHAITVVNFPTNFLVFSMEISIFFIYFGVFSFFSAFSGLQGIVWNYMQRYKQTRSKPNSLFVLITREVLFYNISTVAYKVLWMFLLMLVVVVPISRDFSLNVL